MSPTPPKTDKFAAMAARQKQPSPPTAGESSPPVVKRDKFAAMAARQQPKSSEKDKEPTTTSVVEVVKRDKLAAMAARQQQDTPPSAPISMEEGVASRSDDIAAVEEPASTQPTEQERNEAEIRTKEQTFKDLQRICAQRDAIWADLDQAEALVLQLLDVAQNTSQALSSTAHFDDSLPRQYQTVLQTIHSLLKPHASHIHAYHPPTAINRMYQTRVEWRLAVEAKQILEEYRALEKQESNNRSSTTGVKREIEDHPEDSEDQPSAKRVKR